MVDIVKEVENHQEYYWIKYINQRIRQNKNFLFIITGQTGSGKSMAGLSIGEMLNDDFDVGRVIFTGKELMALINSKDTPKKKGVYILWDEAGIDLSNRNWQAQANKMINFLMQTFRHRCFVLCFTSPYSDFIDKATRKLFHAEFRMVSINFKKRTAKVKPELIQYNPRLQKFYYKQLRVVTKEDGVVPIYEWNIPAPSKELEISYEGKKIGFTDKLNIQIEKDLNKDEDVKLQKDEFYALFETKSSSSKTGFMILESWREGMFESDELAKKLRLSVRNINEVSQTLRKQGFLQEVARRYVMQKGNKVKEVDEKPPEDA